MRIGVDWGGTKIEAVALDAAGAIVARERVATPPAYEPALAAVAALIDGIEAGLGEKATLGFGIPGTISPATGLVKNANTVWLNGKPLDRDLEALFGRPVRIENDANCLAVSEASDGAGAGMSVVWAIILGTGCGSGIAVNGRPIAGRDRVAGEWGHNALPRPTDDERPGPLCMCGRFGCLEAWLSGPALAADHRRATGEDLRAEAVIAAMRAGEAGAAATFSRWIDRLGRAIGQVVNILDPDVIVIGGGLSKVAELYERIGPAVAPHVFSDRFATPIVPAAHGDSSGVRGAAWLWPPCPPPPAAEGQAAKRPGRGEMGGGEHQPL